MALFRGGGASLARMGLLALFWGSSFLWIKLALDALSPTQIALVRCVLGASVLVGLCLAARKRLPRGRRVWAHLVVAATFTNVAPFVLFPVGERTVDSGVAGVLNATTPLWAVLIGIVIGTERALTAVRVGGLLLGFAGTLLIFAPWQAGGLASWGALAILAAAASYGIGAVYIGRYVSGRSGAPIAQSAAQLSTATGLLMFGLPAGGLEPVRLEVLPLIAVAILGVFGTGFANALFYRLLADEGATNAASVGYLLPIVSVVLGAVVLRETITVQVVIGMVVVLVGVGMTIWRRRVPTPAEKPEPAPGESPIQAPELPVRARELPVPGRPAPPTTTS